MKSRIIFIISALIGLSFTSQVHAQAGYNYWFRSVDSTASSFVEHWFGNANATNPWLFVNDPAAGGAAQCEITGGLKFISGTGAGKGLQIDFSVFPTVALTGDYNDLANKPSSPVFQQRTPSLNTAFQVSTTRNADVYYPVDINVTSPLLAGTQGTVYLEYADNSGMSTNLVNVISGTNATSGVLNLTNTGTVLLAGPIPAGKWCRIRTQNNTGTPTISARQGFEKLN